MKEKKTKEIWDIVKKLKKEGKLPNPSEEDILNEPTALAFTPYIDDFSDWDVTLNDGLEEDLSYLEVADEMKLDDLYLEVADEMKLNDLNNLNKELYSKIENLIIDWNNDGTKTAGQLTRKIMSLIVFKNLEQK